MITPIKQVAIVGGTHGNELTGIHLLRRWTQNPSEVARDSFSTHLFLANPKAFAQNRRFIDEDLNRCFASKDLLSIESQSYEASRAGVLNQAIGPKGESKHDFIIDLHTSTSNCGAMIILFDDSLFNLRLAAYITIRVPGARIFYIPPQAGEQPYLNSICSRGLAIEAGPVPQGLLISDIFSLSHEIAMHGLDFAHDYNLGTLAELPEQVEIYCFKEAVSFPVDGLYFNAIIHESLQGRDYQPLNPGEPMFRTLAGEEIPYAGSETVYPVFINEAAYYYKGLAMSLTTKKVVRLHASDD